MDITIVAHITLQILKLPLSKELTIKRRGVE
jgi:hypothetical protein